MSRKAFSRRMYLAVIVCLLGLTLVFTSIGPALSWGSVVKHAYHFLAHNNTGVPVNDAVVCGTVKHVTGGPWHPPIVQTAWSSAWPFTGSHVAGIWRVVEFGPGAPLPPSSLVWFNVDFRDPHWVPSVSSAWFRWTVDGTQVGPWRWLGWRIGSPPALFNPPENCDGSANGLDMVVRDLQFAVSPERIPNDETTLDNPVVQDLFTASADPVRPGPIVIPPDSFFDVVDLDPSITEPESGGQTVLAKGTVEDETGDEQAFVMQFIGEDVPITGANTYWLTIMGLMTIAASLIIIKNPRSVKG